MGKVAESAQNLAETGHPVCNNAASMCNPENLIADILPLNWSAQQIAWSVGIGAIMLIATAVGGALFAVYLPATYFTRPRTVWGDRHPVWHWTLLILKNIAGVVLIVAGVLMLILPGQGVLTIIIGLLMLNFPGKRKFVAELIRRTKVLGSINALRLRFGRARLELPPRQ
jgi:hypothetical protein